MARLTIDTGTAGNPATGDTLRTAMTKVNANFNELYDSDLLALVGGLIKTQTTNGDIKLQPNGTGVVEVDRILFSGDDITSLVTNGSINITANGTGSVGIESISFKDNVISASDSTLITIQDGFTIGLGGIAITGILDEDSMSSDSASVLATQQSIKAYVDTQDAAIASDTLTFTNKTFDADGTGNSLTNIDVDNLKSGVLDIDLSAVAGTDTTLASAKAIKSYVDSQITATNTLTVADDTSTTIDVDLDSTLSVAGATGISTSVSGQTLTITGPNLSSYLQNTGPQTIDGLTFDDNHIKTTASNSDLILSPAGTGQVVISKADINGGTIDNTVIGGATAAAGTFTTLTVGTSLALATGATVTGIDNGALGSSATLLATQGAIKTYVDAQVTAQDLDFTTDDSTTNSIDLDSEVLQFSGGTGITTTATGKTVTTKIDSTVATLVGSQTLTNKAIDVDNNTVSNIEVDNLKSGVLDTDLSAVAGTDTTLASSKAIKAYVDAQNTAQALTFVGDDSTGTAVNTGETFKFAGATGISTAVSGDTITITGTAEVNDLSSAVTWANVPNTNITQASVTQHQAALAITESQVSNLQAYILDANITVVGDDSSGVTFSAKNNDNIKFAGATGITTAVSGDTVTITGPTLTSFITASSSETLTNKAGNVSMFTNDSAYLTNATLEIVGDDSTGVVFSAKDGDNIKFAGATGVTTAVSGDTVTITGPDLSSYLTNSPITVVGDDSTGTTFNTGETIKVLGAGGITGSMSGDTLTVDGSNLLQHARLSVVGDDSSGNTFDLTETNNTIQIHGAGTVTTAVSGNTVTITGPNLSTYLQNTGTQTIDNLTFNDNIIGSSSNADINISPGGTGGVVLEAPVTIKETLVLTASQNDGSSTAIDLTKPVAILQGLSSPADTNTYTLADGTYTGQIMYLVKGTDGTAGTVANKGSIDVVFSKFLRDNGIQTSYTMAEIFSQYSHVRTIIWRGDCWAIDTETT